MRCSLAIALGFALLLLLGCGLGTPSHHNLLLVTIDTLRADRLACYGGPPDVGTAICGLAERGARFEWAFSTAPSTAPSVASILTSQYPVRHGVTQHVRSHLADESVTLAELLRDAGYQTAAFVSNPVLKGFRRLDQGFDHYDETMQRRERNRRTYKERHAADTSDAVLAWAQAHAVAPWFLWVHFQDPHGPYDPPGAARARDLPGDRKLPRLKKLSGRRGIPSYQFLPGVFSAEAYERRYLDEIRFLDRHFARLIDGLDALGDPPAVLLTADHGEALGEDEYYFAHGHSVGLEQIRVPLLWRPPRPAEPRVEEAPVSLIDVAPTLLRVVGVEPAAGFSGRALPVPGARRAGGDVARPVFAEHGEQTAVIQGHDYLTRRRDPSKPHPKSSAPTDRTARLGPGPGLPPYRSASEAPPAGDLDLALREYLALDDGKLGPRHPASEIPDELRDNLRELGYADSE